MAALDVLRGVAVLGILVMNIQSFAMIGAAYINPTAYGDLSGGNYAVWLVGHVLCDMKFMAIFSMLFGAGIVMVTARREAETGRSARWHYRRMGWLLVFGLVHGYLLWYGDILFIYAVCGGLVYLLRRRGAWTLVVSGVAVVAVGSIIFVLLHFAMRGWPEDVVGEMTVDWQPDAGTVAEELRAYRGSWLEQMPLRAKTAFFFQTFLFLLEFMWRAGGLMLVGMGLHKLGVFSARRSDWTYALLVAFGVIVGLPLVIYGVRRNESLGWDFRECFFLGTQFNYWGSLAVSLGWVGLVMLICKHVVLRRVTAALGAVGQMALTNYILQTVICTLIFYGHGLGQFGKVERVGQALTVAAVWAVQLVVSPVWLKHFRFGPLEWLWRTLSYGKWQAMRVVGPGRR